MKRGAIYARISRDSAGLGAGVARQQEDCRAKAAEAGIEIAAIFVDNDVSAYLATPRPGYQALLASIKTKEVDVVLVWHVDRLYRRMSDLEGYISVCQPLSVPTVSVQSGPLDLTTPAGRMVARQLAAVAQYESEQKSVRQQRANLQRAKAGKHYGSRRPFGFDLDGVTVRPDEAAAIRDAYSSVIDGVPLAAIAREWNEHGFATPQAGNPWNGSVLGLTLRNPRLAGVKTYHGTILYEDSGAAVRGEWPALVDFDVWQTAQAVFQSPGRKWPGQSRGLLSGVARCAQCDSAIQSGGTRNGRRRYRCSGKAGHCYREAEPIDDFVTKVVLAYLARPDIWQQITPPAPGVDSANVRGQITELQQRRDGLVTTYAEGLISLQQMRDGQDRLARAQTELERKLPVPPSPALALLARAPDLEQAWAALSVDERRVVIDALLVVKVKATRTKELTYLDWRKRILNPESLELDWRIPGGQRQPSRLKGRQSI